MYKVEFELFELDTRFTFNLLSTFVATSFTKFQGFGSFDTDPDSAFWAEYFFMTKNWKNLQLKKKTFLDKKLQFTYR
jgi:hypothetical protein